jgi:hypothetical protein
LPAAEHRGVVKSSGLPVPGASVTARVGEQTFSTSTDESGAYHFAKLPAGACQVEVEMMGFVTARLPLQVGDSAPDLEFSLQLGTNPAPTEAKPAAEAPATVSQARPDAARPAEAAKRDEAKAAAAKPQSASAATRQRGAPNGRNGQRPDTQTAYQRLQVMQTTQNEINAALSGPPPEPVSADMSQGANESFLVSGSMSRGLQEVGAMDEMFGAREEMRQRFEQMRASGMTMGGPGGSMGGPGGSMGGPGGGGYSGRGPGGGGFGGGPMMGRGPGGPGGFGGRGPTDGKSRGGSRTQGSASFGNRNSRGRDGIHGGASFSLRNSALDAKPYSISGQEIPKPSYAQSRFSLLAGGALRIPKLLKDDKTFFFASYFGSRSRSPYDSLSTVPSLLERTGDFSRSLAATGNSRTGSLSPVSIYDSTTGQPFAGNVIPASRLTPAASQLLSLFPLPNYPGAVQNYQIVSAVPQNSDNFSLRLNRSISRKDRLSGSFSIQQRNGQSLQLFGFRDASDGRGVSTDATWSRTIRAGFINNLRVSLSRNSNQATPYFANGDNWAARLGILGASTEPRNYGPPNLTFTNFGALNDGSPSVMHNQTASISESVLRTMGKHTVTVGFDYRRIQLNTVSDSNARGTYSFSGLRTSAFDSAGLPLAATGFDLADFLLGLPNTSSIRYGSSDVYFRSRSYNAYLQDDFRVRSNLTINGGLRYEFLTPIQEKWGRMANLDIAPGFTGVAVVTPTVAGPYTGAFPKGLVDPDHNNIAPRIGIAWRPFPKHHTQVRAGYGWYFNGSVYNTAANRLAQQPPFAKSSSVNTSTDRPLTIQDGFLTGTTKTITNTFAIDRSYRVGYAQTWNLSVQQELPHSLNLELGYLGTKGTRLDIQRLPNRAASGSPLTSEQRRLIGNATGFTFDASEANSIFHSGQMRLSRRFRRGVSASASYNYGKSIDNASAFGGGVAQDDKNLAAERALSSFDRRHSLSLSWMLSTGGFSSGQQRRLLLRDWSLAGGASVRSGGNFTAMVLGNQADAGGSGAVGSGRADASGLPIDLAGAFFNPAAFLLPSAGHYGNAARNTIRGPSTFAMNLSAGRTIRFGETRRSLDLRVEANNLLNSVNISRIGTTINSSSYGLALEAGSMRSMNLSLRFRF